MSDLCGLREFARRAGDLQRDINALGCGPTDYQPLLAAAKQGFETDDGPDFLRAVAHMLDFHGYGRAAFRLRLKAAAEEAAITLVDPDWRHT